MDHTSNPKLNANEKLTETQTGIGSSTTPIPFTLPITPATDGRKSNKGFASMDREKQRRIASMGGKSVPGDQRSFSRDHNLAIEAGRKGGKSIKPEQRSFSQDRALASAAGRKGGLSLPPEKRSFSTNPDLARRAGRKGGLS